MRFKVFSALAALTIAAGLLVPSGAAAETGSVIRPVRQCAALVGDYPIPGTAAHVTAAKVVPAANGEPEYCEVLGKVDREVGFQLKLPVSTYSGRYLQYGCGGTCGMIFPTAFPACGGSHGGDMAVAATDDGHVGDGLGGEWGATDQAARDDWFFRAPHVVSLAAKRLLETYYGAPPKHSYFDGCSTGGREGLLLAQRYPTDFDGIIAAAPVNYLSPLTVSSTWLARANQDESGGSVLTSAKLPVLHQAVLAACDPLDGLADGQLEDPRACRFDPVSVQCAEGTDGPECLTGAQVETARKIYDGPADAQGRRLYPGGLSRGSELAWDGWIVPVPGAGGAFIEQLANAQLKHLGYPIGTPHSSVAEFEFTVAELNRLTPEGVRGNAMSLDLDRFRRAGGKLILWHGWSDNGVPPAATLDYYQRLSDRAGQRQVRDWARLFMVPSMYHCAGGEGLTSLNPFRELVGWVEQGKAPDRLVAEGRDAQNNLLRTRPVYPYPVRAKYDGTGSIDDASNFGPDRPQSPPRDAVQWAGSYLHRLPGPVAP
ncbi:tannase/feruloyl esterase family alpha/beta hydrolase [Amycolatopsis nigrescens]|uniref:tannase/feruloyl esterase family alpha/beta hydrolase n=1 Tax=Amycolatopsis nigrescens TaxID=381445 RepID=UPI000367D0B6|nr:tannase/feruloyl esterase family alpha/beta hydrolase [Amycolatopsis nigrescens]